MRLHLRWTAVVLGVLTVGCATAYGPDTGRGGYAETQIDEGQYQVEFHGNRYTSKQSAHDAMLYRSAELTLAMGYDYFVVEKDLVSVEQRTTEGMGHYQRISGTEVGKVNKCATGSVGTETREVQTSTIKKPSSTARISLHRGVAPASNPNAHDARSVIERLKL